MIAPTSIERLDDRISILSGYPFPSSQFDAEFGTPLIRIRDLETSKTETKFRGSFDPAYFVHSGDILVGMDGDFIVARWKGADGLLNQRVCKVESASAEVNQRFLFWWLQPHVTTIHRRTPQTTVRHLSVSDLRGIPRPQLSSAEQQSTAVVLDTLDEVIEKTESVIAKLRQVRAGLAHDLLTRGLDENGEVRDPVSHPEQFHESPVGRIPLAWEIATLVSRISLPEGQVDPKALPYREWPLIAPDHIESETGRLIARKTAAEQRAISGKYVFGPGDVVYSKIRPYLRKAVLATEVGLCSADMYPVRPNPGVNPRFLLAVVLGESFSRFASAVSMRSGFPKLNREELAEFVMGWPRSAEQDRIAAVLLALDKEQTASEMELCKLQNLKSGMMSDLLSGGVRVPENLELPE